MPVFPLVESSRVLPATEFSAGAGLGDDVRGGAIFHRSARVIPLGFAQQLDSGQVASETLQAQKRSVADEFETAPSDRSGQDSRSSLPPRGRAQTSKNQALPFVLPGLVAWIYAWGRDHRNVWRARISAFATDDWIIKEAASMQPERGNALLSANLHLIGCVPGDVLEGWSSRRDWDS